MRCVWCCVLRWAVARRLRSRGGQQARSCRGVRRRGNQIHAKGRGTAGGDVGSTARYIALTWTERLSPSWLGSSSKGPTIDQTRSSASAPYAVRLALVSWFRSTPESRGLPQRLTRPYLRDGGAGPRACLA